MLYNSFFSVRSPNNLKQRQSSYEKPQREKVVKLQLSNKINQFEKDAIVSVIHSRKRTNRINTEQGYDVREDVIQQSTKARSFSNAFSVERKLGSITKSSNKQTIEDECNNFPQQYNKIKLLGKGGFSLVWLGEHKISKNRVAIKQIKQSSTQQPNLREIEFSNIFFENGKPKKEFKQFLGIKHLVQFYGYEIGLKDTWLFTEVCGESLGSCLYEIKPQENDVLFKIIQKPFYLSLRNDLTQLKRLIKDIAQTLILLTDQRIVHCDIKTENILIKANKCLNGTYLITQTKLIDYGSSFPFDDLSQFSMATPEYMSPEILNYILHEGGSNFDFKLLKYLKNYYKPWVIDIWSLGCVILEIIYGIPLWLRHKLITKKQLQQGLFAVKNRAFDLIIKKQIEVVNNLDYYLDNNYSGIKVDLEIRLLLHEMLTIDPDKRIAPHTIIEFLQPAKKRLNTQ